MTEPPNEFYRQVRRYVYDVTFRRGYPPSREETSGDLAVPVSEIQAAFQRLADAHMLVLQPDNGEILMASPFSAVPTPFLVSVGTLSCFGNCIWDALGIPAMLGQDARMQTSCADCGTALTLSVVNGSLQPAEGIVHFALPARRWWDNIIFS